MSVSIQYLHSLVRPAAQSELPRTRPVSVSNQEVELFIEQLKGELIHFEQYVESFESDAQQMVDIANSASRRINRPDIWLPHVGLVADTFKGKPFYGARLQFRVEAVRRILNVSTNPREDSCVLGPPRDCPDQLPVRLNEDPSMLFRHISRLFFLPRVPSLPPMTSKGNSTQAFWRVSKQWENRIGTAGR